MANNFILCKEAKYCIDKGFIDVNDDIIFRTIRDVSDLFNKHYAGFQKSWIKIFDNWKVVASCYQLPVNRLYRNTLSSDGNTFSYSLKENNIMKKKESVQGIIKHDMETTYLFLKFPNTNGYKFVGIFEKDIDAMKNCFDEDPKVIYKKKSNRLDLNQFFA